MNKKQCQKCKQMKSITDFNKSGSRKEGTRSYCKDCERSDAREYYQRNPEPYKKRAKKFNRIRSAERLAMADQIKETNGCLFCNETTLCCLDYHHCVGNSKGKEGGMPVSRAAGNSDKQFRAEIQKCVVLCANCHRKVHAGLLIVDPSRCVRINDSDTP